MFKGDGIMKIYISADIEGISGVVHGEHTARDGREHNLARMLMTEEVNAAIKGALEAGAEEIVVNDSHGTMRNLYSEKLLPAAELILGSPKKLAMVEGINESFDAAIFIGYHTRMGTDGILNHTFNGRVVRTVKINGVEYGEFGLNAAVAGHYGVPVVLVSGCDYLEIEALELIPNIKRAVVKKTISRTTAQNLHPENARALIKEQTVKAISLKEEIQPFVLNGPLKVEMTLLNTGLADAVEILPIVERVDPLTISLTANNMLECYRFIRSAIMIANSVV